MSLLGELQTLMVRYRFKPSRALGQNFTIDESTIQRMVELAELKPKDVVLEIGAGTGFLTRELVKHCKVVAVEKDSKLFDLLSAECKHKNLQLIHGDILNVELPKYNKVVSFPPYNFSSKIVYRLLKHGFDIAVLVFQREFIEKISAEPGFLDYGATSVLVNYYTEPQIVIRNISPNAFFPKPQTFSSLVVLKSKKRFGTVKDEQKFFNFIRTIFRLKNKNLSNALNKSYQFIEQDINKNEEEYRSIVSGLKEATVKVKNLSPKQFVSIYKKLYEHSEGRLKDRKLSSDLKAIRKAENEHKEGKAISHKQLLSEI